MSRSSGPEPASRFAVLRHPLFLGALALLLVNDHALKGAGVLPGVVTGKLSDFAGLLVAPLFAATLLGARTSRARALAFAAVALPFAAIKLSAAAASALVALVSLAGIRWRIWQDPTDLVALISLVPAWTIAAGTHDGGRVSGARAFAHRVMERAVFAVTALACVATSAIPGTGTYFTDAYIVNAATHTVDVRVRWVDAKLDCAAVLTGDPTRMLGANAFNLGITYRLEPRHTLPLERAAAFAAAGQDTEGVGGWGGSGGDGNGDTPDQPCEVVLIETDRMAPMMLWWGDIGQVSVTANADETAGFWDSPDLVRHRVDLLPPVVATPGDIRSGALKLNVAPSECAGTSEAQSAVQWTSPSIELPSVGILQEVQEVPGGCLELNMTYPGLSGDPDPGTGGAGGDGGAGGSGSGGAGGAGAGGAGGSGSGGAGGSGSGGAGGAGAGGAGGEPPTEYIQTLYVCVPFEDFPFSNGDEIQIVENDGTNLSIQDFVSTRRLELYRDHALVELGGLEAAAVPGSCEGDRLLCGAYSAPAQFIVKAAGKNATLQPGGVLTGAGFTVRLGRAEQVLVGRDECGPGLDTPGISADFSISWK